MTPEAQQRLIEALRRISALIAEDLWIAPEIARAALKEMQT